MGAAHWQLLCLQRGSGARVQFVCGWSWQRGRRDIVVGKCEPRHIQICVVSLYYLSITRLLRIFLRPCSASITLRATLQKSWRIPCQGSLADMGLSVSVTLTNSKAPWPTWMECTAAVGLCEYLLRLLKTAMHVTISWRFRHLPSCSKSLTQPTPPSSLAAYRHLWQKMSCVSTSLPLATLSMSKSRPIRDAALFNMSLGSQQRQLSSKWTDSRLDRLVSDSLGAARKMTNQLTPMLLHSPPLGNHSTRRISIQAISSGKKYTAYSWQPSNCLSSVALEEELDFWAIFQLVQPASPEAAWIRSLRRFRHLIYANILSISISSNIRRLCSMIIRTSLSSSLLSSIYCYTRSKHYRNNSNSSSSANKEEIPAAAAAVTILQPGSYFKAVESTTLPGGWTVFTRNEFYMHFIPIQELDICFCYHSLLHQFPSLLLFCPRHVYYFFPFVLMCPPYLLDWFTFLVYPHLWFFELYRISFLFTLFVVAKTAPLVKPGDIEGKEKKGYLFDTTQCAVSLTECG